MLLRPLHHLRRNIIAYLALFFALGAGGSYALAATASNGSVVVCADSGTGVMHLAKHQRCGRHQSRHRPQFGTRPPDVSAWASS